MPVSPGERRAGARRAGAAAAIAALTLLGKAAGFGRELLLARYFGATKEVDALILAMTPVWAIILIVGESLRYTVIPDLSTAEAEGGLRGFWCRAREIAIHVAWFGLAASLVLGVGARTWVALLAGAAPAETRDLAVRLAPILAPVAFAALVGTVLAGVHSARGYVVRTVAADLSYNTLSVPVLLLFAATSGITAAAWGWTAGYLLYATLLAIPLVARRLPRPRPGQGRRSWIWSTLPMVIAAAAVPVTNVVDRAVASGLPEGSIAALNYALKIVFLPLGIVVSALGSVTFPEIARRFAMGDTAPAAARLRGDLAVYAAIMIPAAGLVGVLALPVIRLLFERGAFDRGASTLTAHCLRAYAGAIVFHGVALLLGRAATAGQWLRIPVIASAVGVTMNGVLDVVLTRFLGAPGIGLAFSIAVAVNAGLTYALLQRRLPSHPILPWGLLGRIVPAAGLSAVAAALCPIPDGSPLVTVVLRGGAALLVLVVLYQSLGIFRACASYWSGRVPTAEVPR